jgi:hypothetical protein
VGQLGAQRREHFSLGESEVLRRHDIWAAQWLECCRWERRRALWVKALAQAVAVVCLWNCRGVTENRDEKGVGECRNRLERVAGASHSRCHTPLMTQTEHVQTELVIFSLPLPQGSPAHKRDHHPPSWQRSEHLAWFYLPLPASSASNPPFPQILCQAITTCSCPSALVPSPCPLSVLCLKSDYST